MYFVMGTEGGCLVEVKNYLRYNNVSVCRNFPSKAFSYGVIPYFHGAVTDHHRYGRVVQELVTCLDEGVYISALWSMALPEIAHVYGESAFYIWVIRNPYDAVRSARDHTRIYAGDKRYPDLDGVITGVQTGDYTEADWKGLCRAAKLAWLWSFTHARILNWYINLDGHGQRGWKMFRIEDWKTHGPGLLQWMDAKHDLRSKHFITPTQELVRAEAEDVKLICSDVAKELRYEL